MEKKLKRISKDIERVAEKWEEGKDTQNLVENVASLYMIMDRIHRIILQAHIYKEDHPAKKKKS